MGFLRRQQDAGPPPMGPPAPPPMTSLSANPIAAAISITIIMVVVVTSKSLFRKFNMHKFGWDDTMALIGMLLLISTTAVITSVFQEAGLGSSTARASIGEVGNPKYSIRLFIYALIGNLPNAFAKLSIFFLLLEVFPRVVRPLSAYFVIGGMVATALFYTIMLFYFGIHCGPHNSMPCTIDEQNNMGKATAVINMVLDIYIFIIAIVNVWTMQLNIPKKIGVTLIFGMGTLALVCSIIALYYRTKLIDDPNAAWAHVLTPLVMVIYEPAIALMTASLPSFPSLFRWIEATPFFSSVRSLLSKVRRNGTSRDRTYPVVESSQQNTYSPFGQKSGKKDNKLHTVYDIELGEK